MLQAIRAIFENGVFRPLDDPQVAEHEHVQLTVEPISPNGENPARENGSDPLSGIRAATGISDLAENFDDYRLGARES